MAKGFNLTAELNLRGPSNVRQVVSNINKQLKGVKASVNLTIDPNSAKNIASINRNLIGLNKTLKSVQATSKSVSTNISGIAAQFNTMSTAATKAASSTANVSQNISNTGKQAQAAGAQVAKATTLMEDFGKQSALAVKRFAAFSLVTSAVFSLTNAINQAFKQFIEFDRQLVRLQQVTGKTADGLKAISSEITNLSTSLGVASSDLISVSTTLAQAGLSARETEKALKALALSALAPSFDDLNRTVEGSIALMRQFGISAGDLEKALGSVNAVAASFAVEAGDIIAAIQRTGGVFAAASRGVSEGTDALNEFVAVFTSVRATTRESAETIATGLRTIFTRIQRGSTIEALKEFGITLTDVDGKFVGAYKAIQLLSQGLNQLDPRDVKFSTLVEELGGFRQIGKVIPLIQQFATAQKALAVAQAGQGSLAEDAATAQLSLSNQISKVREEFLGLIREIGGTDSFKAITKSALDLASALIQIADSVKGVLPVLGVLLAGKGLRAGFGFAKGFGKELKGKASGGLVTKYAAGGLVDVALMPGETVVSPEVVKKIGVGTLNRMNKADKMAKGGLAKVPGTGRADSFYTQIPAKSYVIRTDATNALGDKTISDIASGRQKFADGGQTKKTQQGKQVGGVGVFDSDMIGAGSKQILNAIRSSGKPYSVISGPAGSGKTTFATRKFGKNFIRSAADIEKYARFAVLSGAGATKTGDFSTEAQSLMSGAAQVIALQPSSEQVMSQRQQRIVDAESSGLPDTRSIGQLKGTMKAPTQIDSNLYKKFGNVQFVQKFDIGGEVKAGMVISEILDNKLGKVPISAKDVAFANPQVSPLASGSIAKLYAAPTGNKIQIGSASKLPLKDIEGIISRTVLGGSKTKTYNTEVAGVGEGQNEAFNSAIQKYTKEAIENSAKAWGRSANVSVSNVEFAEDFSIPGGQVGSMFEQMIQGLAGEPIASAASEDKRPFDFTNGLGRLVKRGDTGLFAIDEKIKYVDAKKGINSTQPSEFKKKISNQLAIEDFSKVQAAIQQRMNERTDSTKQQGVEGPTRDIPADLKTGVHSGSALAQRLSVKNSASAISKLGFEKSGKGWSYRQRKQASMAYGGEVPILAQEGEYVINRNSARSIGYGNLEKLNKYHSGGRVQKMAGGGKPKSNDRVGSLGLDGISGKITRASEFFIGALERFSGQLKADNIANADASIRQVTVFSGDLSAELQRNHAAHKRGAAAQTRINTEIAARIKSIRDSGLGYAEEQKYIKKLIKGIEQETAAAKKRLTITQKLSSSWTSLTGAISGATGALTGLASRFSRAKPPDSSAADAALAAAVQSQVKTSNASFARGVAGGFVPEGASVGGGATAAERAAASREAVDSGAATAWSPAVSAAMRGSPSATRSGRAGGTTMVPAQSPDIDVTKTQSSLDRLSSLATSVAVGLPLLSTAINGNREATTASEAANQSFTNGLATNLGVVTLVGSELRDLTKNVKGTKGRLLRFGAGVTTAVSAALAVGKAFVDASEASRKFKIESAKDKIEEGSETVKNTLEKLAKSGDPLSDELDNLDKALAASAAAAQEAAKNMGVQTQRASILQTLTEGVMGGGGDFGGGQQGAANRSIILQEKGTLAYLAVLGDTTKELKYMSELAPKIAKESSNVYAQSAKQFEDVLVARLKEGESLSDIMDSAAFDQNAEALARQNQAIEKQIVLIESDTRLGEGQKKALKDNIIALESQRVALEKAKQVNVELALKDLDNATKKLSYSFSRIMANMDEAIARSVSTLGQLDSAMQENIANMQGQATSGSSTGIQQLLDVISTPRAFSAQERQSSFSQATAGFGSSSDSISKVLEIGATLEDTILGAVNNAVANSADGTTEEKTGADVSSAVKQQLKNIGLPPGLSEKLSAEIGRQVATLRKEGDDNIDFSEIVEKVPAVGQALESFKTASQSVENRLKFLQSTFEQLSASTNELIGLQIDSNNRALNAQQIVINGYNALSQALGRNTSLAQKRYAIESKITSRTGGSTDPAQIRRNITNLSDQKTNLESGKAAAQAAGDVGTVQEFEKQIKQTSVSLNENVMALKDMAENTDLASAALGQIEQAQQKQRAGIGIIEKLVTSTPKQLNELNQSALRLSRNMSGVANFGTTSEQRGQDLELFNMIAPLLGDQAEPLKANVLQSMLQQSGVGVTPMFQQILDTMRNPQADPVQAEAIKTYQDAIQKQSEANVELANINNNLANDIANQTQKGIEAAIKNSVVRFDDKQITDLISGINNPGADQPAPVPAVGIATGGLIYKADGGNVNTIFKPKGTDTVPAMLTPGEFVVNKASTQKHLPLLQSINKSKGGDVSYYAEGGTVGGYKTNWAKENEDDQDRQNVSRSPIPYINPKIFDELSEGAIFGSKGNYVPVYGGNFDYTAHFLKRVSKSSSQEDVEKVLKNEQMNLLGSPAPALIGWKIGDPPFTQASLQEAGLFTGGDKVPKWKTQQPLPSSQGFDNLGGGIPINTDGTVPQISPGATDLYYDDKIQRVGPEGYPGTSPDLAMPYYSIQGQKSLAEAAINKYQAISKKLNSLQFVKKTNDLVPANNVKFLQPGNGKIPFYTKSGGYGPFGRLNDRDQYDGLVVLPQLQGNQPTPTNGTTKVNTFGEVNSGDSTFFGNKVRIPGHVGIGPQTITSPDTTGYQDPAKLTQQILTAQNDVESIKSTLDSYAGDPGFFDSISTSKAANTNLGNRLKNLESGSLGSVYTTIGTDNLNKEWKSKTKGDSLALFIEGIRDKWNETIGKFDAQQKRDADAIGAYGDGARVGGTSYLWSGAKLAANFVSKYFAGEDRTQKETAAELPAGFKIGEKQLQSFDLTSVFADIGPGLGSKNITGAFNAQEFEMPSYTQANKYSGVGDSLKGVMISDGMNYDTTLNPFDGTALAGKTLYFKDLAAAQEKFRSYYDALAAAYDKENNIFANEPGITGLMELKGINPDIAAINLDPVIAKNAKEKIPLEGNTLLQDSLIKLKERYLSQVGGEAITGKSATIDPKTKGQDWLDLGVIQDIVRGVVIPYARNIVAMGGRLPNIGSIDGLGAFAEYVSQGADYIGSRARSATDMPAIIFGQLKALGEIFSLISQNKKQEVLSKLGLPATMSDGETPPVLKDAASMTMAIQKYGQFLTQQGALSLGGDATALNQPVDQNYKINGQSIADIFKSGKVELAEVDAATGSFTSSQASEAQAPKDLKSVGKLVLNPYNVLPSGVRQAFTDNLVNTLMQARFMNAAEAVKNVGSYLAKQDNFLLDETNAAQSPAAEDAALKTANQYLLLLTNGVLGLIPDNEKLQQIKAARAQRQKEQEVQTKARGGLIYASNGTLVNFQPQGTDTVPAMLTPGEFVINRQSTQKHLPLLKAINNAGSSGLSSSQAIQRFATGGIVQPKYYQDAGMVSGGNAVMKPVPLKIEQKSINDAKTAISSAITEGAKTLSGVLSGVNILENSESFVNAISSFTRSVNNIVSNLASINLPEQIQFTGNVQVNLTGANNLTEAAESIVNNAIRKAFGDLGVANEGSIVIPQQFK